MMYQRRCTSVFWAIFAVAFLVTSTSVQAGLITGGEVVVTYNSTGPAQFLFGTGITQAAFQHYDRTNELNPFPPLLNSTPSTAGDALSHSIVLGGPLRVTNLDYNDAGATLNDIWTPGQTLSVDGRTLFTINANPGTFITFGDYNIIHQAGQGLVFRDTGLNSLDNVWNTANVTIDAVDPLHLVISGDLLVHPDVEAFFGAAAGTNVGTFRIDAISAVPEPSSVLLVSVSGLGFAFYLRKKNRKASAK